MKDTPVIPLQVKLAQTSLQTRISAGRHRPGTPNGPDPGVDAEVVDSRTSGVPSPSEAQTRGLITDQEVEVTAGDSRTPGVPSLQAAETEPTLGSELRNGMLINEILAMHGLKYHNKRMR
eukprot:575647-Amphidinium_carterae.1